MSLVHHRVKGKSTFRLVQGVQVPSGTLFAYNDVDGSTWDLWPSNDPRDIITVKRDHLKGMNVHRDGKKQVLLIAKPGIHFYTIQKGFETLKEDELLLPFSTQLKYSLEHPTDKTTLPEDSYAVEGHIITLNEAVEKSLWAMNIQFIIFEGGYLAFSKV